MDGMVAIDPKLFITCRLCLEEMGQYQILPIVKQQLKFCFDIDVAPFDGFPQLICSTCKQTLINVSTMKKKFMDKQRDLQNKLLNNINIAQQDTVTSTQTPQAAQPDTFIESTSVQIDQQQVGKSSNSTNKDLNNKLITSKKRVLNSSSSDSDTDTSLKFSKSIKKLQNTTKNINLWESKYAKKIMCRLCNTSWSNIRHFNTHNRMHEKLRAKSKNLKLNHCTVNLNKIDNKPNITGLNDAVVYDNNKIMQNGNPKYYILYSKTSSGGNGISSYTSDEDELIRKPKSKQIRSDSESSSDTIVLESKTKKSDNDDDETAVNNCINLDDSSESDSIESIDTKSTQRSCKKKKAIEAKLNDYKTIHHIASTCTSNYRKKKEDVEFMQLDKLDYSENNLRRIILNIGSKLLNKQGFKCTGLLTYLEHKNLELNWILKPSLLKSHNKDTNLIHICTTTQAPKPNNNQGWVRVEDDKPFNVAMKSLNLSSNKAVPTGSQPTSSVGPSLPYIEDPIKTLDVTNLTTNVVTSNLGAPSSKQPGIVISPQVLNAANKLLNANPVANPKQLPKKQALVNEVKPPNTVTIPHINDHNYVSEENFNTYSQDNAEVSSDNNDSNLCMPIITSTTSLAEPLTNENKSVQNTAAPRIKVKPVSELMSERCLNNLRIEQQSVVANSILHQQLTTSQANPVTLLMPSLQLQPQIAVTGPPLQLVQLPCVSLAEVQPSPIYVAAAPSAEEPASNDTQEYIILTTVELPNTKTNSPFKYFKSLLQFHNLVLIDSNDILSREFKCLVKFKVVFKQDSNDKPVFLCLALFCSNNKYCLKVKNSKNEDMDVYKLTANWQWEILKVYTGVMNKVLQNAEKISQETYNRSQKFVCLLKSIAKID